jgi:hypothetical protein
LLPTGMFTCRTVGKIAHPTNTKTEPYRYS